MADDDDEVKILEPYGIIGFDGITWHGLRCHPDGVHLVYPMGNKVCIQNWLTKKMSFLSGHTNIISAVTLSSMGRYIGSGQINHIGFKALIIVWDFNSKSIIGKHEMHKVRVESITFSWDEMYMISIGGRDCGQIVVWDVKAGTACATATATKVTTGDATMIKSLNKRNNSFIMGGNGTLRLWDVENKTKLIPIDIVLSKLKRTILSITIDLNDEYCYCGTLSGDILKIYLAWPSDPKVKASHVPVMVGCNAKCGKWKKGGGWPEVALYSQGVRGLKVLEDNCLVVGAGDGTVEIVKEIDWKKKLPPTKLSNPTYPMYTALKSLKLDGGVTSLQIMEAPSIRTKDRLILVGTKTCEIYSINMKTFEPTLVVTCHKGSVNTIAFPKGMSGVFCTSGSGDVRIWSTDTCQELLRIVVPNFICSCAIFSADGKSVVTAWNDACIRSFTPLTGRLIFCMYNTHCKGTSALAMTDDCKTLVSGGCEGQVCVWEITSQHQSLKKVLKEHKSPVSAIRVNPLNTEAISAGTDGSCIIWDLISLSRRQIIFANTLFNCVCYHPSGCLVLTGGTDRQVGYWEVGTGKLARELEASRDSAINTIDISSDGEIFVTGGNDQIVKVWKFQEGIFTHLGLGHSAAVTAAMFTPDARRLITTGACGDIIVWKVPPEYIPKDQPKKEETPRTTLKIPRAPIKVEQITAIDTSRESVHSACPCDKNSVAIVTDPCPNIPKTNPCGCIQEGNAKPQSPPSDVSICCCPQGIKTTPTSGKNLCLNMAMYTK